MPLKQRNQTKPIWHIDWILSGTTIPSQSGPGSYSNESVYFIFARSSERSLTIKCSLGTYTEHLFSSPRTFSKPMYSTRPCCLVQAITRHTCPDPHLGSWNCLPHQAHIVPSEPMSSIDQQGSSLGSFPTFSPPPLPPL